MNNVPWNNRSPVFEESVDALLLSLHSVSALNKVQLMTDSLIENLAAKILSMCHTCPSLLNIWYDKLKRPERLKPV